MLYTLGALGLALLLALGWGKYEQGQAVEAKGALSAYKLEQQALADRQQAANDAAAIKAKADADTKLAQLKGSIPALEARAHAAGFNDGKLWADAASTVRAATANPGSVEQPTAALPAAAGCEARLAEYRQDLIYNAGAYSACYVKWRGVVDLYNSIGAH